MSDLVNKTPAAPAARIVCEKQNCDKSYVQKGSYNNHMRKHHQPDELIASPLGNFPPLALFVVTPGPAVQGNSRGDVNSPPVLSGAKFLCQICDMEVDQKEDLNKHMENHNGEESRELSEALEDTEDAKIAKELEDMVEKVKFLYRKDCHECEMRKEIETHKELELNKKDSKIEMLERKLKAMELKKNEYQKELKKTKTNETCLQADLKKCQEMLANSSKKVAAQTAVIDTQKSSDELTNNDGNQKIKCGSCDFNARHPEMLEVHMKAEHLNVSQVNCKVCSKGYPNQDNLEVHMAETHTGDIDCGKCKAVFRKEQDVFDHANDCTEILPINTCDYCKREVISKSALTKHMNFVNKRSLMLYAEMGIHAHTSKPTGATFPTLFCKASSTKKSKTKMLDGKQSSKKLEKFCGLVVSVLPIFTAEKLDETIFVKCTLKSKLTSSLRRKE